MTKHPIFLAAALSAFFFGVCYGGDELFTWKDEQGGLHITDVRPPVGAEIINISPNNLKAAEEVQRQRLLRQEKIREEKIRQDREREIINNKVAEAIEKKAAIRKANEEIEKEKAKKRREKRRRRRHKAPSPPTTVPTDSGGIENSR
ncbi:MAG: DUF4124 domain-containing protein [Proteobacteria bacterium]|nr:DUF4124 domain-containing protein [Pseudomonadota bacterium]MBU1738153.1 DUF4124 domain-containing protein [Pseudomonadota bacterium]